MEPFPINHAGVLWTPFLYMLGNILLMGNVFIKIFAIAYVSLNNFYKSAFIEMIFLIVISKLFCLKLVEELSLRHVSLSWPPNGQMTQ